MNENDKHVQVADRIGRMIFVALFSGIFVTIYCFIKGDFSNFFSFWTPVILVGYFLNTLFQAHAMDAAREALRKEEINNL